MVTGWGKRDVPEHPAVMQSVAEDYQLPIAYKVVEHHNLLERRGRVPFAGVVVWSVVNIVCILHVRCVDEHPMQEFL